MRNPDLGDIWKVRDPRRESYFKIVGIFGMASPRTLVIRSCARSGAETSIDRQMSESRLNRCDFIDNLDAPRPSGDHIPVPDEKPFFQPSTSDSVVPLAQSVKDPANREMVRQMIDRGIDKDDAQRRQA